MLKFVEFQGAKRDTVLQISPSKSKQGIESKHWIPSQDTELLDRECWAYSEHIENLLSEETVLFDWEYLPLVGDSEHGQCSRLLSTLRDGVVLSYLISELDIKAIKPSNVKKGLSLESIGKQNSKTLFEVNENLNLVVEGAKSLKSRGVVVVNVGANDILDMNIDIVLGLVWQLVRAHLLKDVNLVTHPELIRLLKPGESLQDLISMNSEAILIRWFNYHLVKAGEEQISNLAFDLSDGKKYRALLKQVCPESLLKQVDLNNATDRIDLASHVLKLAQLMGCRKFVTAKDIVEGHHRLNLAFTAGIFNDYIGILLPNEDEIRMMKTEIESLKGQNRRQEQDLMEAHLKLKEYARVNESLNEQMISERRKNEEHINEVTEQLSKTHLKHVDSMKAEHEFEIQKFRSQNEERLISRESELKAISEAMKAKNKQQMYMLEREYLEQNKKIKSQLMKLRSTVDSFLAEAGAFTDEDDESRDVDSMTESIMDKFAIVSKEYRKMETQLFEKDKTIARLEHVKEIFGDKIQEYAESKNLERVSSQRRTRFPTRSSMFFRK